MTNRWTPDEIVRLLPGVAVLVAIIAAVLLGCFDPRPLPGLASVLTGAIGWAGGHSYGFHMGAQRQAKVDAAASPPEVR